jgi:hypothetical protein
MPGRRIVTARDQHEMLTPWRIAAPVRHPDLEESLRLHGAVHTTGGRRLSGQRLAVADQRTQETRLADPAGWERHLTFTPSGLAIQGARAYTGMLGMGDPHVYDYSGVTQTPDTVRTVGRLYDALPGFDKRSVGPYQAMRKEVSDQYDFLTNRLGIKVQSVDHDPYQDVHHMMDDINNRKTLKVMGTQVTGGHPFFTDHENDMFRAVHDFFGHAATGRSFDRHGEQAAYLAHSQMFTPHARPALTTETKGQNSSLILNGHFPDQKIATLPNQHWDDRAVDLSRLPLVGNSSKVAAGRRRFTQDWQHVGGDYMPVDVVSHYMQRKETGFGDEKAPLYELTKQPPLSQQITDRGYEKPVELCTDGRSGSIYDGHHRIDIARQLGHSHVPVQVTWRSPHPDYPEGSFGNPIEPWLKSWITDMRGGRETVGKLASDGWGSLSHEDRVSVAENVMERSGFGGKVFHVPTAYLKDAEQLGMFDHLGRPDARTLQRQHSKEAEDYVNGILESRGYRFVTSEPYTESRPLEGERLRVEPEHWDLRESGSGQAFTDGYSKIGLSGNHVNQLTLLHEAAHVLHGTPHGGHREGHGLNFQHTLHSLYREHLGPEAADIFAGIVSPDHQ